MMEKKSWFLRNDEMLSLGNPKSSICEQNVDRNTSTKGNKTPAGDVQMTL